MKLRPSICLILIAVLKCQLALAADNRELTAKNLDKGLNIDFWYGGWEPDYTKTAYEAMFSYRAIDKIHLYAGLGDSKQVFYDRTKIYAGGYYFYEDYSYIRLFISRKKYDYPIGPGAITPNPDSSSYDKVPRLELEVSQYFSKDTRGTLTYELSRPNFFHDKNTTITVQKLGGELSMVAADPKWHPKIYASLLRDPDPNKTEIRGFDNPLTPLGVATSTQVAFRTASLLGGAVQYAEDDWDLEVKYLQNRDLDNSYNYSLLNKFAYRIDDNRSIQLDYVYDKFSNQSNLPGMNANVYMASYFQQISPGVRYGLGYKHIDIPNRVQDTGFIYIQAKTGVLW